MRIGTVAGAVPSALMALLTCAQTAASQEMPSAAELVSCFEARHSPDASTDACPTAATLEGVLLTPNQYDRDLVAAVLDGLGQVALSSPGAEARVAAAIWLRVPGDIGRPEEDRIPGVVRRMGELVERSDDATVRRLVADYLRRQAELEEAVELLQRIARENRPEERANHALEPAARHAVQSLANMGEPGSTALRQLHEEGRVVDPRALSRLRYLATTGFREQRRPKDGGGTLDPTGSPE